jgi:ABC-type proline/glycine betaine transport system permease subunit
VFVLGKTFTVPGVALLALIITPLSIATKKLTSASMNNAQGWLAVGFLGSGFILFAIIKLFIWDCLNNNVENAKCDALELFHSINLKHKPLNSLSLP